MDSQARPPIPVVHLIVRTSKSNPSEYKVFVLRNGNEVTDQKIQVLWDNEQKRQKQETDIDDGPTCAMQQLPEHYKTFLHILIIIEYPELGCKYYYTDSHLGVSLWYFQALPSLATIDGARTTLLKHRFFSEGLVLVSPRTQSNNVALMGACRPLPCGCEYCNRSEAENNHLFTIYLNNKGVDANQEPDGYMTIVVCGYLDFIDFLNVIYNGNAEHVERPNGVYFKSIVEAPAGSSQGKFEYGRAYGYEEAVSLKTPIMVKDLEWFAKGEKHVVLAAVIGGCYD